MIMTLVPPVVPSLRKYQLGSHQTHADMMDRLSVQSHITWDLIQILEIPGTCKTENIVASCLK